MEENVIELLLKIRGGDNGAFESLCELYRPLIDSMAGKFSDMYPDKSVASSVRDDFFQESQLAFYNAAMRYNAEERKVTFGAFAKTCIRNRLVSCLRSAGSKKRRKCDSGEAVLNETPQDTVIQHELEKKRLSLAEKVLSNYEMRIFKMYARGAKAKEISAKIGKDEKSVNNAIFRIRTKLKKQSNNGT